jgi:hypothetical protein
MSLLPSPSASSVEGGIAVEEMVEKDTEDHEEIPDLMGFIAPSSILSTAISFGMHYNSAALNGWVKQPSPCCGAASVAGTCTDVMMILLL